MSVHKAYKIQKYAQKLFWSANIWVSMPQNKVVFLKKIYNEKMWKIHIFGTGWTADDVFFYYDWVTPNFIFQL